MQIDTTQLKAALNNLTKPDLERAMAAAQREWAERLLNDTVALVPFQTGTLQRSARVLAPEIFEGSVETEFGYGGDASAYALYQHEGLTFKHPIRGQSKFLEQPVLDRMNDYGEFLAQAVTRWVQANTKGV